MNTRTNIVLDDELVAKAMERAGVTTKKAAIEAALRAFVSKPDYTALLALEGSGLVSADYDPKALFVNAPAVLPMVPRPMRRSKPSVPARKKTR